MVLRRGIGDFDYFTNLKPHCCLHIGSVEGHGGMEVWCYAVMVVLLCITMSVSCLHALLML